MFLCRPAEMFQSGECFCMLKELVFYDVILEESMV